jgi:hypothetical protein
LALATVTVPIDSRQASLRQPAPEPAAAPFVKFTMGGIIGYLRQGFFFLCRLMDITALCTEMSHIKNVMDFFFMDF